MKLYQVRVNASPRYPIWEVFDIKAANWATAITRGVREYFKKHKGMRAIRCDAHATFVQRIPKEVR